MIDNLSGFEADFFERNRRKFIERAETELSVICANGLLQKSLDAAFPFRQDSNFWYLTGINSPSVLLVIDGDSEYLILPTVSEYMQIFDGGIDVDELTKISGVKKVYDHDAGWEKLRKALKKHQNVGVLTAAETYVSELDMFTNPARGFLIDRLQESSRKLAFTDLRPLFAEMRMIKQPEEIAAIEKATELTMEAFVAMSDALGSARSENDIEQIATIKFIKAGQEHAYTPIVAAGKNATILHYIENKSQIKPDDMILIDIGASFGLYASDLTRTICHKPSVRSTQVHKAVQDVLEELISHLRPGITLKELEVQARDMIGQKLIELGLIDEIDNDKIRQYYPHSTSHCIGLDVHDPTSSELPLEPGMVLTIEPGIYIQEESIGVRIEDIAVITEDGCRVISAPLSRGINSLTMSSSE